MEHHEQQKLERLQVPEIGELLDGRYRIQGVIATGGMGVILRAEQLPMQRPVAIKLLHPHIAAADSDIVDRFEREVRLAKQLNHPNTIRLYDFGESDQGLVYVAMELLEGMDLKRLIAREGGLRAGRALEICRQMLDGLAEAHAHDFIHRDLKPSNVFITQNRRGEDIVKLLDFGIAKSLSDASDLTGPGSICGTPAYVAPEYLMQEAAGKPSDVYAVGLILLEMLTGRQVFKGEAPVQTMMMHLKLEPELPDDLEGSALGEVIERATAKDPRERFQDAEAMFRAVSSASRRTSPDLRIGGAEFIDLADIGDDADGDGYCDERRRAESDTIVPETARPHAAGRSWKGALKRAPVMVFAAVLMLGVALLWAFDPGRAPELESPDATVLPGAATPGAPSQKVLNSESHPASESEPKAVSTHERLVDADSEAAIPVWWSFELDTDPSGAVVSVGGQELGRTPLSHEFAPDDLPETVRFELEGYEAIEVELTRVSSPIVVEVLEEKQRRTSRERSKNSRDIKRSGKTPAKPAKQDRSAKQDRPAKSAKESSSELSDKRIDEVVDQYFPE